MTEDKKPEREQEQEPEPAERCLARRYSPGGLPCELPAGHEGQHKHKEHRWGFAWRGQDRRYG